MRCVDQRTAQMVNYYLSLSVSPQHKASDFPPLDVSDRNLKRPNIVINILSSSIAIVSI